MSKTVSKSTYLVMALVLMLSLCFTNLVSAESISEEGTLLSQTVTNEYDLYKDFQNKSDEQLVKEGYTQEKIKELKSLDYKGKIKKKAERLAKVDIKKLEEMGYTKDQIKDIKQFTGTEEQIYSLSATLALSTYYGASSKSSTYSQINFRTDWTWSSAPYWLLEDILAVPWSEGMYLDTGSSSTYGQYSYYDEFAETFYQTYSTTVTPDLNKGASIKFDTGYHDSDFGGLYAKKGKFGYKLFKSTLLNEVAVQPTYGHTTVSVGSPSVSFPAGLSVSFSYQTSAEASNYFYKAL